MFSSHDKSPRNTAMDFLSRREHSYLELFQKLKLKGFEGKEIELTLDELSIENLQSDQRFTQNYTRYRSKKGFGPIKIKAELIEKGISSDQAEKAFKTEGIDWRHNLLQTYQKKYNSTQNTSKNSLDIKIQQKQQRFLLQRGFSISDIMRLFTTNN